MGNEISDLRKGLAHQILFLNDKTVEDADIDRLFNLKKDEIPGTFSLADRKDCPDYISELERDLGYTDWVKRELKREILLLTPYISHVLEEGSEQLLIANAITLLDLYLPDGKKVCEATPNQLYTDIFRRILMLLLFGDPTYEIHTFREINQRGLHLAIEILNCFDKLSIEEVMKMSTLAGLIGLDQKNVAAMASHAVMTHVIPIGPNENPRPAKAIFDNLIERIRTDDWAINCWPDFYDEVLQIHSRTSILWFTDDFIETVFDLFAIQELLSSYSHLNICLVPRKSQYVNDASYLDIQNTLSHSEFSYLKNSKRFTVCSDGPQLSAIDPRALSPNLANIMMNANVIVVKGARAHEMLQGLKKPTYYLFSVCREISESVTGVDASLALPVMIRQAPGDFTFLGYKESASRKVVYPSGRIAQLCPKTAYDYVGHERCAFKLPSYEFYTKHASKGTQVS